MGEAAMFDIRTRRLVHDAAGRGGGLARRGARANIQKRVAD
jgi:hypothetical protein